MTIIINLSRSIKNKVFLVLSYKDSAYFLMNFIPCNILLFTSIVNRLFSYCFFHCYIYVKNINLHNLTLNSSTLLKFPHMSIILKLIPVEMDMLSWQKDNFIFFYFVTFFLVLLDWLEYLIQWWTSCRNLI